MPSPDERDQMRADDNGMPPVPDKLLKALEDAVEKYKQEQIDARSKQCTCPALFTNATCPIHGPAFIQHLENRK